MFETTVLGKTRTKTTTTTTTTTRRSSLQNSTQMSMQVPNIMFCENLVIITFLLWQVPMLTDRDISCFTILKTSRVFSGNQPTLQWFLVSFSSGCSCFSSKDFGPKRTSDTSDLRCCSCSNDFCVFGICLYTSRN